MGRQSDPRSEAFVGTGTLGLGVIAFCSSECNGGCGHGQVLRDGMGQATGWAASGCLDAVVTNALVVDHTGIFKCDIGIKVHTKLSPTEYT
jgi:hypothetical protein